MRAIALVLLASVAFAAACISVEVQTGGGSHSETREHDRVIGTNQEGE